MCVVLFYSSVCVCVLTHWTGSPSQTQGSDVALVSPGRSSGWTGWENLPFSVWPYTREQSLQTRYSIVLGSNNH